MKRNKLDEMVDIGSGAQREMDPYTLSCYVCCFVVQNGDSAKNQNLLTETHIYGVQHETVQLEKELVMVRAKMAEKLAEIER